MNLQFSPVGVCRGIEWISRIFPCADNLKTGDSCVSWALFWFFGGKDWLKRSQGLNKFEKDITSDIKDITCFHSTLAGIMKNTEVCCGGVVFAENRFSLSAG